MKIYVGNLNFDTSEAALRDAFGEFGEIEEVVIISDRETGRSRGFGFVTMPDDGQAKAAIEAMNGQSLDGRSLNVNEARPKAAGGGRRQGRW